MLVYQRSLINPATGSFFLKLWLKFKEMTAERLEQAKQEISGIEERLRARMPDRPWEAMKDLKSRMKDIMQ